MSVSILILTKNEERDLPGCLKSVRSLSDDIQVLDSFSTDRTISIAQTFGARITQRSFDNWSSHQNWALKNIYFKYPWVFYMDADERSSHELLRSIRLAAVPDSPASAFQVQRRDFFSNGTWLKHSQISPFFIRLFRPERIRYERLVNPITIVDGSIRRLEGFLDHYPFSKGIPYWIERHLKYADFEAQHCIASTQSFSRVKALFSKDFHERRTHQKAWFYTLPLRPLIKFMYMIFLRRAFLDGRAGLTYCMLQTFYEYLIVLRSRELKMTMSQETSPISNSGSSSIINFYEAAQ
jgi:glycosyltransferase involved in cell wall biosynthesis